MNSYKANKKNNISVCIVAYNEEKKIRRCLDSIKNVADEIIVVHDGPCQDRTLDIAKEYTDKIIIAPRMKYAKEFSSGEFVRAEYLKVALGDWILTIDADERLSPELSANLCQLTASEEYSGYDFLFPYVNEKLEKITFGKTGSKRALLRKNKIYYIGLTHLQAEVKGRVKLENFELWHEASVQRNLDIFRLYNRKNWLRSKATAKLIAWEPENIIFYNCSLADNNLKHVKKVNLMIKHPVVALFVLPFFSFFNHYAGSKYFLDGFFGFVKSGEIANFYFYTCVRIIYYKIIGKKNEES